MLNFMYMIQEVICQSFTRMVGRWQNGITKDTDVLNSVSSDGKPDTKALLVQFRRDHRAPVQMIIHAPANYVGVYVGVDDEWECKAYHDSCWRSDGVERFLWQNREKLGFIWPMIASDDYELVQSITDSIHIVRLSKEQLDALKSLRDEKYNRV
jgi:hypothetical protein